MVQCIGLIVFLVFGTSVNVALVLGYPLLNCLDVKLFRSLTNDASEWCLRDLGLWALGFGLWALGFGLWALGYGLWALGSGLWALGFGLWALGQLRF